jgi:hypothetical protein
MTQRITRMISISRDNIMQFGRQDEFFNAVPGMQELKAKFTECHESFERSAKERGCRCRADNNVLSPCVQAFIEALNTSKDGDGETMRQFIQFVAKTPSIETTGVTIYYAPPNGETPQRYSYP